MHIMHIMHIMCIMHIMHIMHIMCFTQIMPVLTAPLAFPGSLNLPRPLKEIVDDTDDTTTKA